MRAEIFQPSLRVDGFLFRRDPDHGGANALYLPLPSMTPV
jgi:hypothetical protein